MSEPTDIVVVGLRALAFIAVMQSAGSALYYASFGASLEQTSARLRKITLVAVYVAVVLIFLEHIFEPSRLIASFSGIWNATLQSILLQSDAGAARSVRILGLMAVALALARPSKSYSNLLVIGATLTLSSFVLMGHTADHPQRWLLAVLLTIHLMIAAFWFGALLAFLLGASRESPRSFGELVLGFSRFAGFLVPVIALAGLVMAFVLLPDLAALSTSYGRLLIAKTIGFALLLALAAWNRFRLAPAIVREKQAALSNFRTVVAAEWALLALVLVATAVMTGLYGPEQP